MSRTRAPIFYAGGNPLTYFDRSGLETDLESFEYGGFHTTITNEATGAVTDEWFTSNNEPFQVTRGFGTVDASTSTFSYDLTKAPNTVNSYDKADQLETGTGVSYSYDEMGERTQSTPTGGPATSYTYNQAGDLTSVKRPKEGAVSEINETSAYNGTGMRMSQTISGATSYMTWDTTGSLPLVLNDGRSSYIYGPGNVPLEEISSEEIPTYYHHDQLGSTRMLTSSGGEAIGAFSYGSYGALEGSTGAQTTPLGYAGQYTDESELQYLHARYYDSASEQFITRDPVTPFTHAPYGYAHGNPLGEVDPSGYCGVESVGSFLESINPISTENCAYQAAESLNSATGIDLPGTLSQPAVVDAGAVGICLIPGADLACGAGLAAAFGANTASVVAEGVENSFCDLPHLLAEESVNALLLGFGGLGMTTLNMAGDAPLFAKVILRGGPAAAQGLLDLAHGQ